MGWSESLLVAVLSCATFLLPSLLCGPQYSGNLDINIDQGMIDDIFGSSLDSARYGNTEEEWVEVPIELLPGEGEECGGMQQPRTEPSMVEMFEELAQIAVIKADGSKKCDFYTQTEGFECVPYYQCDEGTIITDGYGLIDIRFGGSGSGQPELAILDSSDLMCPGSLDVCCKDPDFVKEKEELTEPGYGGGLQDDEDFDDDGILNHEDEDDDNDGIHDCDDPDDDNDGIYDIDDDDDDNDGIPDTEEFHQEDPCDGRNSDLSDPYGSVGGTHTDFDNDGMPNDYDNDDDNDGVEDDEDEDDDDDGIPDDEDEDDDNDGIPDDVDDDIDDEDDDNDGIPDTEEKNQDQRTDEAGGGGYGSQPEKLTYQPQCGRRNHQGLGVRIQNYKDGEAQFGEWPHMCAVLKREIVETEVEGGYGGITVEEEVLVFVAGASLVAPGVAMTGAHKVQQYTGSWGELVVRCGEWDTQTESEPLKHQDRNVRSGVTHQEFNPKNLQNTIALLFLETEFVLDSHVDTICLPQYQQNFDDRQHCFVKGWGKDHFGPDASYQVVMKEVEVPMVRHATCQDLLRATPRLPRQFRLHSSFVCAGGEAGKDACRGDGGGPLVCAGEDEIYTQVGIVAWGIGCGEENVPGVYTDVAAQVCWIDYVMSCQPGYGNTHVNFGGPECNAWLQEKQSHRVRPLRLLYNACHVTWSEPRSEKLEEEVNYELPDEDYEDPYDPYGRK